MAGRAGLHIAPRRCRDDGWTGFASLEPHLRDPAFPDVLSGPRRFGEAAHAFRALAAELGITLV